MRVRRTVDAREQACAGCKRASSSVNRQCRLFGLESIAGRQSFWKHRDIPTDSASSKSLQRAKLGKCTVRCFSGTDMDAGSEACDGIPIEYEEPRTQKPNRILLSAILTLTLSILGSSVLPVPFAFSRIGVFTGVLTMVVVAAGNALASVLLISAAAKTGHTSYEGVAEAVGGQFWKVLTQVSLVALLFGTIVGDFALLGDVGIQAAHKFWAPRVPPAWIAGWDGRILMVAMGLIVFPICCLRRMRSLEVAGTAGLVVIVFVIGIIVYQSIAAGMPAIASGEMPLWTLKITKDLPEAFSVMGFAFYVTPMILPLRAEMPPGKQGDQLTKRAIIIVITVIATLVYGSLGIFGAARHGLDTAGNIMVNRWLPDRAQGVLDAVIGFYLAISIPPIALSLRYTMDCLIAGEGAPFNRARHLAETTISVFAALGIALIFPKAYEIFAITGASAVCLICYVIPVALHLMLRSQQRRRGSNSDPLLQCEEASQAQAQWSARVFVVEVLLPSMVALLGVGVSIAALWVSLAAFFGS